MRRKIIFIYTLLFLMSAGIAHGADDVPPINEVTVTILLDADVFDNGRIGEKVKTTDALFSWLSAYFEKEFRIRFRIIEIKSWEFSRGKSEIEWNAALKNIFTLAQGAEGDIAFAITEKPIFECIPLKGDEIGIFRQNCPEGFGGKFQVGGAYVGEKYNANAALIYFISEEIAQRYALHEVGHLFGADHPKDTGIVSIMHGHIRDTVSLSFDEENKNIILKNRSRPFSKSIVP